MVRHDYALIIYYSIQGRGSHIGKLGMCLGQQVNRGGTPHQKEKRERKRKSWEEPQLYSHLILQQYRLIWYQNEDN